KLIATASRDGTAKIWSLDGQELHTLKGHEKLVNQVSFSPNGKLIATASRDGTAKIWSLDSEELHTLKGHEKLVNQVRIILPDGELLTIASNDGTVKVLQWHDVSLENFMAEGCALMSDYLKHNPNVSESDKDLCDGVLP
ncbi:MAG: hypothetical protein SAQ54_08680, partial [Oscillatoria sp. PMC 1050.18]|nr:hypothetical protein [Oscillatoria sp. PMC 1050.18]